MFTFSTNIQEFQKMLFAFENLFSISKNVPVIKLCSENSKKYSHFTKCSGFSKIVSVKKFMLISKTLNFKVCSNCSNNCQIFKPYSLFKKFQEKKKNRPDSVFNFVLKLAHSLLSTGL